MSKKIWIETHLWLNSLIQESSEAKLMEELMATWADIKARTETHRNEVDFKWPFMAFWR